ncbi:MAG: C25 family cysteine peptidase, partial [Planctomycetaceae bacterium]|nr:C25 family cysteine peptidase [Planctomycetaceae bacterium]
MGGFAADKLTRRANLSERSSLSESKSDAESDLPKLVLVVSPKIFNKPLEKWIQYRANQGYHIKLINTDGTSTPQEIRERMIGVVSAGVDVSAVLLVGVGAVRSELGRSFVVPSPRLVCRVIDKISNDPHLASDDWYVDFNKDNYPDCPIGRLPANSPDELEVLIQKIIRYESAIKPDIWCRQFQVVAGSGEFSPIVDAVIEAAARHVFTDKFPASREVSFLFANWQSRFCPSPLDIQNEYLASIERAPMFWIYIGHGQHRSLQPLKTPKGLFETFGEKTQKQPNNTDHHTNPNSFPVVHCKDSLPIAMLLCCYGGVPDAQTKSVAEELILQRDGPIAVVGASRVAMPYGLGIFGVECLYEFSERQADGGKNFGLPSGKEPRDVADKIKLTSVISQDSLQKKSVGQKKLTLGSLIFESKKRMLSNYASDLKTRSSQSTSSPQLNNVTAPTATKPAANTNQINNSHKTKASDQITKIDPHKTFRRSLETFARLFDPLPYKLDVQLEEHVELMHLFGDPLLELPVSLSIKLDLPQQIQAGKILTVKGQIQFAQLPKNVDDCVVDGRVMLELVVSPSRISLKSQRRSAETCCGAATRVADNEEYKLANQQVILRQFAPINGNGSFAQDFKIPNNLRGKYLIRTFCPLKKSYALGSTEI